MGDDASSPTGNVGGLDSAEASLLERIRQVAQLLRSSEDAEVGERRRPVAQGRFGAADRPAPRRTNVLERLQNARLGTPVEAQPAEVASKTADNDDTSKQLASALQALERLIHPRLGVGAERHTEKTGQSAVGVDDAAESLDGLAGARIGVPVDVPADNQRTAVVEVTDADVDAAVSALVEILRLRLGERGGSSTPDGSVRADVDVDASREDARSVERTLFDPLDGDDSWVWRDFWRHVQRSTGNERDTLLEIVLKLLRIWVRLQQIDKSAADNRLQSSLFRNATPKKDTAV